MTTKIAIIGAGISGLNCARHLEKNPNVSIDIFEKDSSIGGRIQTDEVDGFLLDRGFQVFLKSYPEAIETFDYSKIELFNFLPGAEINGEYIGDPLRTPSVLISTLFSSIGNLKDKLLILKLRFENKPPRKKISTLKYLKEYGFSEKIINKFFRPFFSGVFLNKELENDAEFFLFLYKLFSIDYASIPKQGMGELPKEIERLLTRTNIHLNSNVEIIENNTIRINDTKNLSYDHIISAHPSKNTSFYQVTTDYFWTDKSEDLKSPSLKLFTKSNYINHIAPISLANPNYAPEGKVLFSVNSLNEHNIEKVKTELHHLFPGKEFRFLKRYSIPKALPKIKKEKNGLQCGDWLETPSINGALVSGRKVAEKILNELRK